MDRPSGKAVQLYNLRTISSEEFILLMVLNEDWKKTLIGNKGRWSPKTVSNMLSHLRSVGLVSLQPSREAGNTPQSQEDIPGDRNNSPEPGSPSTEAVEDHGSTRAGTREDIPLKGPPKGSPQRVKPKKPLPKNSKTTPHPRWMVLAKQLGDAIKTVRNINTKSKLPGWSEAFRTLHSNRGEGIPTLRIRQVLNWYCSQIRKGDLIRNNPDYIPIAYSGAAFKEKFLRIEDAMTKVIPNKDKSRPHINPEPEDRSDVSKDPEEAQAIMDQEMADHNAFWDKVSSRSEEE